MKTLLLISMTIFLAGCSLFGNKEVQTVTKPTPIYIQHPTPPEGLTLRELNFKVLNKEKILEMLGCEEQETKYVCKGNPKYDEDDFVFIVVTPQGYENLSLNMREIKRYIEQQKEIILFYRDTIKTYNQKNDQ